MLLKLSLISLISMDLTTLSDDKGTSSEQMVLNLRILLQKILSDSRNWEDFDEILFKVTIRI